MKDTELLYLNRSYALRNYMASSLRKDLVGPASEDEVFVNDIPIGRYISGILYPRERVKNDPEDDRDQDDAEGEAGTEIESAVVYANKTNPSSIGLSFALDTLRSSRLMIEVQAARYRFKKMGSREFTEVEDEHRGDEWHREALKPIPLLIGIMPGMREKSALTDASGPIDGLELHIRTGVSEHGIIPVTIALTNRNTIDENEMKGLVRSERAFFQVGLEITCDGSAAFVDRHLVHEGIEDEDTQTNQLLHRHTKDYALGHGCATGWDTSDTDEVRSRIWTTYVPHFSVKLQHSNPKIDSSKLTMTFLANSSREQVISCLQALCNDYSKWIEDRTREANSLEGTMGETAQRHLAACRESLERMRGGIGVIEKDNAAWKAFQWMNEAMREQMLWGMYKRKLKDIQGGPVEEPKWYPFQIAFVLQCLRGIAQPKCQDRGIADLLWFPTGGGKTEAYLGLVAFAIFLRRLNRKEAGVTAIMRYTLRLLTIQQFQRAAAVICACEAFRRNNESQLGNEEISLGLWVGGSTTPNKVSDAQNTIEKLRRGAEVDENPMQLLECPCCGSSLSPTDYLFKAMGGKGSRLTMSISCPNPKCQFNRENGGIPAYPVDEDIYQHRPDLIIATVDKYAQMAWEGKVADLFNRPSRSGNKDISPPDLIIQDELHLISGPLGTMTGLYESAVDYCCSEGGIEPKIIASTATIRGARKQVLGLFDREVRQFPSPGLDSRDSFFAVEADPQEKGTREYVGVASPGMAHARLLTRVYASLLQSVCEEASSCVVKDPYWTLIGYFNSLKVLGSSLAQVEEEVPLSVSILSRRHGSSSVRFRKGGLLYQELDSNIKSSKIPEIIKGLGVMYNGDPNGPAFDIILATNMISVGMDVSRLGLMAVMGTPPSTSEYIQSTSRVGRSSPGLVVMMYNDAKTRDKSYYESFMQYHSALYTHVESTSLTPFSIKARERGLHAVIVAMVRISIPEMREDEDAGKIGEHKQEVLRIVGWLLDRISRTSKSNLEGAEEDALDFVSDWEARAEECRLRGSILCYRTKSPPNARTKKEPLLRVNDGPNGKGPAAIDSTEDGIPTMMSLRDVDRSSNLFLWEGD